MTLVAVGCTMGGFSLGYLLAINRTPRLLARMTPDELRALAARVRTRKGTE